MRAKCPATLLILRLRLGLNSSLIGLRHRPVSSASVRLSLSSAVVVPRTHFNSIRARLTNKSRNKPLAQSPSSATGSAAAAASDTDTEAEALQDVNPKKRKKEQKEKEKENKQANNNNNNKRKQKEKQRSAGGRKGRRTRAAAKAVPIAAGSSKSRLYDGVASDAYILAALLARTQLGISGSRSGSLGLAAIHHSAQLSSGYLKCVIAINSLILIFRKTKLTIPACLSLHPSHLSFCLSICLCSAFFQLFGCVLRGWHFLSSEAHKPHSSSANWKNH